MTVWVARNATGCGPAGSRSCPVRSRTRSAAISPPALVLSTPAGFQEVVFRSGGWDLSRPMPEGWRPTQDALRQAAEQAGVTLIGPPHGPGD